LKSRSLVLLSGETTSLPEAEARALFLAYDPSSRFESPEGRVLLVESVADPAAVASRVAFSRRVGVLVPDSSSVADVVRGKKVRVRSFSLPGGGGPVDPDEVLGNLDVTVDLENPAYEFTVVSGKGKYLALTCPATMRQEWSRRSPRRRPFFHPSAIFPKLSRALVNLSRCKEGELFLDPFCGTGSLPLEASEIGACALGFDLDEAMTRGAVSNMRKFGQQWLGVVRCDSFHPPIRGVDAIATDVPYGRASSTRGRGAKSVVRETLETMPALLKSGSRMVIMHSDAMPVEPTSEWAFEEEHRLYVHKLLTRAITILRRK
jgi:tRNA (guanine10-N2)-dimethyltransferase